MTRTESLADLALWATDCQSGHYDREPWANYLELGPTAPAARSHGLSAVRAIRRWGRGLEDATDDDAARISRTAATESRLAVRAALNAVGIRGAL